MSSDPRSAPGTVPCGFVLVVTKYLLFQPNALSQKTTDEYCKIAVETSAFCNKAFGRNKGYFVTMNNSQLRTSLRGLPCVLISKVKKVCVRQPVLQAMWNMSASRRTKWNTNSARPHRANWDVTYERKKEYCLG